MKLFTGRMLLFLALVLAVGMQSAYADSFSLRIYDGATWGQTATCAATPSTCTNGVQVMDQAMSYSSYGNGSVLVGDLNPGLGVITEVNGRVGNWLLSAEVGTGYPSLPVGSLNLTFNAQNGNPSQGIPGANKALVIELSQIITSNTMNIPAFVAAIGGTLTVGQTVTYSAYGDDLGNALFTYTSEVGGNPGGTMTFSSTPFAGLVSGNLAVSPPYTLTQRLVITPGPVGGQATGAATLTPVPEPTTLTLLGAGLACLALLKRRK